MDFLDDFITVIDAFALWRSRHYCCHYIYRGGL